MAHVPNEPRPKSDRLEIRLRAEQRRLLHEAAAASAMSVSAFVLMHATDAAKSILADRTLFDLPAERWDEFVDLLDREPQPMPGLSKLLAGPSVLDE
jgi:uncharacterized protein (DUF1778 family)